VIEQDGIVIAVHDDLAEVEGRRQSMCGGCAANGACGTSLIERFFGRRQPILTARNPIGAHPGDVVVVGMPESALVGAAIAVYLVPLLTMIAGAIGGDHIASVVVPEFTRGVGVLGGMLGLAFGLWWLARFSRSRGGDARYQAVILRRGDPTRINVAFVPLVPRGANKADET
jgi:sigma-E factor negative regulatory protein RseC